MSSTKITVAPYDADGNLLKSPGLGAVWRPNQPFRAVMTYDKTVSPYQLASYVYFLDQDKHKFPMFTSLLPDLLNRANHITRGVIPGVWMVAKRGESYSLRLAKEDEYHA